MSSQRMKQLLSADWSYITLLHFIKLSTQLIDRGSHKLYATLTTLAVVWALFSFRIFFSAEMCWWALKEWNSCCLLIDLKLRSLTLLSWAHCWWRRVPTRDMQLFLLEQWLEHSFPRGSSFVLSRSYELERAKQLPSTDSSYIVFLNFVNLSSVSIKKGTHKRYTALTTLAMDEALCSFRIVFWA